MQLIFATNNENKIKEISPFVYDIFELLTLKQAGLDIQIPEPYDTLEENASEKSKTIYKLTGINCFSEDTGLETEALNGEPGVKSARYAGEDKAFDKNMDKLLSKLNGMPNRKAQFRTVISLILDGREYLFEGVCKGEIIKEKRGSAGFGYDPIFIPSGANKTFAEMTIDEKSEFSHRKKALNKLIVFLKNLKNK
ncbi:MAG TPA: RdgB/HAM1 family non-canonical purine NTP pyrophosphatase [Chitinophagaceae bacterium]